MKTRLLVTGLFAVLMSVFSCTREKVDPDADMMVFYANSTTTRTELQSDGAVFWSPKDEIAVYHNDYHGRFASTNTKAAASVEFRGILPSFVRDENQYFYAFYPCTEITVQEPVFGISLPAEQTAVEDTFADDLFISASRSKDNRLYFHNVCGGVKFSVAEDGIKKVVFKANGEEPLAGKLYFEFDSKGIPIVSRVGEGTSAVTLTVPDNGTFQKGKWYFLVLAPGTLSQGYTMEFYSDDLIGKVASNSPIQVKRSIWGVLRGLEPKDSEQEGFIETSASQLEFYSVVDQPYTQSMRIKNTGKNPVTIHSVSFSGPFSSSWDSEITIDTGKEIALDITLSSSRVGSGSGEMIISYGSSQTLKVDLPYSVFSFGQAIDSDEVDISFTVYSDCTFSDENGYYEVFCDFGYVKVGEGDDTVIVVKNKGKRDIRLLVFGNPDGFYINKNNDPIDLLVPPSRSKEVVFYFTPKQKASYSGSFTILIADTVDPDSNFFCFPIHLSGLSKDVTSLYISKKSIEFSRLLVGYETESFTITVSNGGEYPVDVTVKCPEGFAVDKDHFHLESEYSTPSSRSQDLTVTFNPRLAKSYSGKLVFEGDNLYGGSYEVDLSGIGLMVDNGFVDFGTNLLWAGCNLGASAPTGYGDYYAWGEKVTKPSYSLDNYNGYDASTGKFTTVKTLEGEDDVATQRNSKWRTPTYDEWNLLIRNTSKRAVTLDGVNGILLMGNKEGYKDRVVFLPFAGAFDGTTWEDNGVGGYYWSSTSAPWYGNYSQAYCCFMESEERTTIYLVEANRYYGFTIRPVSDVY